MYGVHLRFATFLTVLWLMACGSPNTPLDAATRSRIDSIANAQIALAQTEYDSICKSAHDNRLPIMVDSLKQVRLRRIEEQLKTIPK